MASSLSKDYLVGSSDSYLLGVRYIGGKGGVGPKTIHHSSPKVDCCIDGGDFMLYQSIDYSIMIH